MATTNQVLDKKRFMEGWGVTTMGVPQIIVNRQPVSEGMSRCKKSCRSFYHQEIIIKVVTYLYKIHIENHIGILIGD